MGQSVEPLIVRTPRLLIRPLRPESDLDDLHRIGLDDRVAPMMATIIANWTKDQASAFLDRSLWRGALGFRHAIALADRPDALIGTVGIGGTPVSTAYFLDPDYWGKGYATEALSAFLAAVIPRFSIETVTAGHFVDNPVSGAVLRKVGFTLVGEEPGRSAARLEPETVLLYRLEKAQLKA
jgi:RimJ/RimL family protein N-acetyltransferase